jgi:hypothetical protein
VNDEGRVTNDEWRNPFYFIFLKVQSEATSTIRQSTIALPMVPSFDIFEFEEGTGNYFTG